MKRVKYYSRKFLNKSQGTAFIECEGEVSHWALWANVRIADCNKTICLDFGVHSDKDYKGRIAKIDLLISELTKVKSFLENNIEPYKELREKAKAKNKLKVNVNSSPLQELLDEEYNE
jgi:hypothetical protein